MVPSHSLRLFGAVSLLAILTGCTAESTSTADNVPSASTPTTSADGEENLLKAGKLDVSGSLAANVTVEKSNELLALGKPAEEGKVFLTVTLAMANRQQAPLLVGWQNFSLRTRSGSVLGASPQSSSLPNVCDGLAIAKDSAATCAVAFEVEQGEGLALVYGQSGAFVSTDLPPADGCHGIAERGSDVSARVSPDIMPALPIADRAPDGLYTLVRADLFTDRERPTFNVPASTVYLRGSSFDEVSFAKVTTRVSATLEITGSEPTTSRPSCASPAPSSELVRDTVYWAAADDELVLERPYEGGVLRRMYKRTHAF